MDYLDSLLEVCNDVVDVLIGDIVRAGHFDLSNVAVDYSLVKADGFNKEQLKSLLGHDLTKKKASLNTRPPIKNCLIDLKTLS